MEYETTASRRRANGESLTGFLLAAGSERAEVIPGQANQVALSAEDFERFVAALGDDPEPMPTLQRYAALAEPVFLDLASARLFGAF